MKFACHVAQSHRSFIYQCVSNVCLWFHRNVLGNGAWRQNSMAKTRLWGKVKVNSLSAPVKVVLKGKMFEETLRVELWCWQCWGPVTVNTLETESLWGFDGCVYYMVTAVGTSDIDACSVSLCLPSRHLSSWYNRGWYNTGGVLWHARINPSWPCVTMEGRAPLITLSCVNTETISLFTEKWSCSQVLDNCCNFIQISAQSDKLCASLGHCVGCSQKKKNKWNH